MTQRILFVCLGNICRSPTAEGVFATLAVRAGLSVAVDSAGTSDWHVGDPPYGPMQRAAQARGYDLSALRARQATAKDFEDFDLILVMDESNLADMEQLRPAGSRTPVRLFLDYAETAGVREVPDPYYTRDFDTPIALIEAASRGLIAQLLRQ
ncbi:Low molecular weight protein-tyrosine-phosphatase YfkJ [Pseudoruegeria aquimaris]|uniref:protein-tyrosine-phosphatase n=1 Tax=Pseudoruegeria aquimaris TaxID=393663 RepID=A0A1Y5SGE7_9RHOB|nr:low molecular weight protein-tyrosine-phosphatase [Pseudoruegeria aquimaris]SLN39542.1 Low molecular weight protein-tyrosine-phosphatase YfkJ [Pseudoruegeria aquimaris]